MRGDAILTPDTVNGYDPETVKSYEIGLKGTAVRRPRYRTTSRCSTRTTATSRSRASSRRSPADRELRRQRRQLDHPGRRTRRRRRSSPTALSLTYGVGWTDAEFDKYETFQVITNPVPPPATLTVPVDLADTAVFQNTPEWNGNLSLNYAQPLPGPGARCSATLSGSYRDSYHMFEFPNPLIDQNDAYTLVDASLAWTSRRTTSSGCSCSAAT